MKISRSVRVSGEYQKAIAEIISGPLKNECPDLTGIISVTKADISSDLKNGTVYISIYARDEKEADRSFSIICAHAGFIRHELSQSMRMRTVPSLRFVRDDSMAYGSKIDELIRSIHTDREEEE
ncbi:MAG: 30S ribosome-binding factor RbfA [Christensenellaceae bacterium]